MSLNKFMHPRNRYKNAKPSFLHLALKYPDFRAHTTQDESGKVFLDFKNADSLRALTTCLLKEDFDLSVVLPSDRLVPTLPLRLNYIHWLEDIIGTDAGQWGIDIGTGASCIYPLLAAKMNKWHFLATEADAENVFHANKNVETNGLQELIHVKQVSAEDALTGPLESFTTNTKFDFCMCNPPFFADHMEAQAITNTRSVDRPDSGSVSTASPQESIIHGGEVGFIRQMIEESAVLRDRIRVYSSMVGKKASLSQLKEELRHMKVTTFATTEFCQGKTMRWGIAWSYDNTVTFPKSQFESRKEKPPLQYIIPKGARGVEYKVHDLATYIRELLESLKIHCYQGKKAKSYTSITLTAVENTWCHQRRLRRQQQRKQLVGDQKKQDDVESIKPVLSDAIGETKCTESVENGQSDDINEAGDNPVSRKRPPDEPEENACTSKKRKEEDTNDATSCPSGGATSSTNKIARGSNAELNISDVTTSNSLNETNVFSKDLLSSSTDDGETSAVHTDTSPKEYILKCVMRLKRIDEQVQLELEWLGGQSRELLHQVMTFLKNKLSPVKK